MPTRHIDKEIISLYGQLNNSNFPWLIIKNKMQECLVSGDYSTERMHPLKLLTDEFKSSKNISVLDYGCGTGINVILLLLLNYKKVHGVDVVPKFDNKVSENLGFSNDTFALVDKKLPYANNTFDVINSSLVLEHVFDLDSYYKEASRVLKKDGVCFFNFPHRGELYDSHSRTWFIHWFPRGIRKFLWSIFSRQGGVYLDGYLNLQTVRHHKKVARKYFSSVEDRTSLRIKNMYFSSYKGNISLRKIAHKLMNMRFFGSIFVWFFSLFATADLYLKK